MSNNATISYEKISDVLGAAFAEFRKNPRTEPLFVFPTEIEKNSWIDWAVLNTSESKVDAVNTEQFIAWDEFKSKYIQPIDSDKNCIPPIIRKIFAQKILQDVKFKKLISKDASDASASSENSDSIFAFTDWLAKILPSLAFWKKHYENDFKTKINNVNIKDDDENADFLAIYEEYKKLLSKHNFFEPSYAEINFSSKGRKIYIFYPTIIQDFSEYIDELASSENVTLIVLPPPPRLEDENSKNDYTKYCVNYPDARKEIRRLALQIRELMDEDVNLQRVAVNVPDLENIRPYIEREFRLYEIPFVIRNGIPYTKNCGGDIFGKIKDCIDSNYSLDAVRNLLLDGFIPWRYADLNLRLIQAGVKQRIVCSSSDDNDIWLASFEGKNEFKNEKEYYEKLKHGIEKFRNTKSFKDLKFAWLEFSDTLIDEKRYKREPEVFNLTDKILGRIIMELSEFSDIEENFNSENPTEKLHLNNYLDFFVNEMNQKSYTPNEKKYGVNIFSYGVAACTDFDYHFIVNANQGDITVSLKTLSFITNEDKRKLFGLTFDDETKSGAKKNKTYDMRKKIRLSDDGSAEFVRLYNAQYRNAEKKVFWSSAKQNFNGAAITHTALKEFDTEKVAKDLEKVEKAIFTGELKSAAKINKKYGSKENYEAAVAHLKFLDAFDDGDFVKEPTEKKFTKRQMLGFDAWAERNFSSAGEISSNDEISENLKNKVFANVKDEQGNIKISASSMNSFFPCPKKWLFQNVMGIDDEKYSAKLAEANEIGTLYHKVLELYFGALKGKKIPQDSEKKVRNDVRNYLTKAISEEQNKIDERKSDLFKSKFSTEVLERQRPIIEDTLTRFLVQFCKDPRNEENPKGKFGGYTVEDTEKAIGFSENGIRFKGKIDLLLTKEDEVLTIDGKTIKQAVIIDYKTGTPPTTAQSLMNPDTNKIGNFQMAMYVKLLEHVNGNDENAPRYQVQKGLFYSLKDKGGDFDSTYVIDAEDGKFPDKKVIRENFTANGTEALFMDYANEFAEKIKSCDFKTNSKYTDKNYVNPYEDCVKCRFKSTCRTTFNIGKID